MQSTVYLLTNGPVPRQIRQQLLCHPEALTIQVIRRLLPEQESCKIVQCDQGMVLLIKLIPLTVQRFVKAITAMSSLNLDEGRAMRVTMLRTPFRSSNSTSAEISHVVKMDSYVPGQTVP